MKQFFLLVFLLCSAGAFSQKGCLEEQLGLRCLEDSEPFP